MGSIPTEKKLRNNLWQVDHTYVSLPSSSITCYWSKDDDDFSAGKVTAGLAESTGSLTWADDLISHLRADCLYTGISSGPNAQ